MCVCVEGGGVGGGKLAIFFSQSFHGDRFLKEGICFRRCKFFSLRVDSMLEGPLVQESEQEISAVVPLCKNVR